ncbi:MAG: hypothetical protein GKS00_03075 [Alphaproteobacteria bacterium]|nr:hypothetical protein [Alphaproteobacteria bacterium]
MDLILSLYYRLIGREHKIPSYLSGVSRAIDMLSIPKSRKIIWGGLLYFIPVLIAVIVLFWIKKDLITHGALEIGALLLAVTWGWMGPSQIWFYERYTLPRFHKNCRRLIPHGLQYQHLKSVVFSPVSTLPYAKTFEWVWRAIVMLSFLGVSENFLNGLGIYGIFDWLWWAILVGVWRFSYYTSLGFCLAYKTLYLTKIVATTSILPRFYHRDQMLGFSFVGEFSRQTSVLFFSGWAFAPLLFALGYHDKYHFPFFLLICYFIFTVLTFFVPIYVIREKIKNFKDFHSREFCLHANNLAEQNQINFDIDLFTEFDFYRKRIIDLQTIQEWPVKLNTFVKFVVVMVFIPLLIATTS